MNSQTFYQSFNSNKTIFSKTELSELVEINKEYPYFQAASMLMLKAMRFTEDNDFKSELAKTATIVLNREVLFNYIYPEYNKIISQQTAAIAKPKEIPKPKTTHVKEATKTELPKPIISKKGKEISSKTELMEEVKTRLKEIDKEKSKTTEKQAKKTDKKPKVKTSTATLKKIKSKDKKPESKQSKTIDRGSKLGIIESFIKNNPGINKPEDKDYKEEISLASKSLKETYDLVSETMAELFLAQGHPKKAIKIYEKLILIYPEKSTYFAARISKLKD